MAAQELNNTWQPQSTLNVIRAQQVDAIVAPHTPAILWCQQLAFDAKSVQMSCTTIVSSLAASLPPLSTAYACDLARVRASAVIRSGVRATVRLPHSL